MFCVKCGKKDRNTVSGLCMECYLDGRDIITLPHHVDLERCTNCEEFFVNGSWKAKELAEAVEDAAADSLMAIPEAAVLSIATGLEELDPRNYIVNIQAETDVDGRVSTETASTTVRVKNTVCKRCSRQLGNYYEATLQIRTAKKNLEDSLRDEIVRKIRNDVEQMSRNNRQLFITSVTEVAGGVDMLLSSISLGRSISKDLGDSYGAEVKESSKLVGKTSDGEDMYRLTFLVRLPEYHVGDIVRLNGEAHKLTWIGKNGARLLKLKDFREMSVKKNDAKNIHLMMEEKDLRETTVVSVSGNEIQVLHPTTFSTIDLRIPDNSSIGETVNVALIDDDVYYVP